MSDCSTNAMKPKERPRTCGNCKNVEVTIHKVRCPHRRYLMERFIDWIGYPRYEHYAEDSACENYVPSNDSLEQRYQQLEQVAREMYKEILHCEEDNGGWWHNSSDFREQLEALGVSLDD